MSKGEALRRLSSLLGPALMIVAVQALLFPVRAGILLHGISVGMLVALIAVGMALIYRANRIVNFAQGELGMAPAVLAVILIQSFAWNYFLGLGVGLAAGIALGALAELAIIRRFFRASRLILTVATIGLAQLLVVVIVLAPRWLAELTGRDESDVQLTSGETIDFPWKLRFTVDPLPFTTDHIVTWIVAPAALVAVALFLRHTGLGIALRGAAERPDRAALLGVPVKRLNTYVWAIAGGLSFVGMFLRAGIVGLPRSVADPQTGTATTLTVLLLALAALMLGRLSNLATIATSAVALGMLEVGVAWNEEIRLGPFTVDAPQAVLVTPLVGLVIVGTLLVRRAGADRAHQESSPEWHSAGDVRPTPAELRRVPEVVHGRHGLLGLAVVGLLALPHLLGVRHSELASLVIVFALITLSIVVLTGWAGQVSLGQMGFVAIGGAVAAVATQEWGLDLTVALLVAGVIGAAVAVVVGLPALRLRPLYLAVVTLAFGVATTDYFLNRQFFDWVPTGRVERPPLLGQWDIGSPTRIYYVALVSFGLVAFLVQGMRRARIGRVLVALRDNERAAQAYGVSVVRAKLTAFAVSGFIAAFAGGLLVHHQQAFSLTLVRADQSLLVFTAAVVGGLGSLLGGVLGAVYVRGADWFLPTEFQFLSTSAGVLLVLLLVPGGLGGLAYRGRDLFLRWVAGRRGITSPSLLADTKQREAEVQAALQANATSTDASGEPGRPPVRAVQEASPPATSAADTAAPRAERTPAPTSAAGAGPDTSPAGTTDAAP